MYSNQHAYGAPVSAHLEPRVHVGGVAPQHRVVHLQTVQRTRAGGSQGHTGGAGIKGQGGTWNMGPV